MRVSGRQTRHQLTGCGLAAHRDSCRIPIQPVELECKPQEAHHQGQRKVTSLLCVPVFCMGAGITLRLQFPREDLGFAYLPSTPGAAVAPEGSYQAAAASASNQAQTAPPARDAPYEPNSLPGA